VGWGGVGNRGGVGRKVRARNGVGWGGVGWRKRLCGKEVVLVGWSRVLVRS